MAATTYGRSIIFDHAVHKVPFVFSNLYVALFLADPTSAGLLTSEVSVGEYERLLVQFDSDYANTNELVWAVATTTWGTLSHVGIIAQGAKGFGNLIFYEPVPGVDPNVTIGKFVRIPIGQLSLDMT